MATAIIVIAVLTVIAVVTVIVLLCRNNSRKHQATTNNKPATHPNWFENVWLKDINATRPAVPYHGWRGGEDNY